MIKKVEDLNYYELLEISPTATSQEIHKAYERIRRVYEPNSVALYSLFTPEETSAIHQRIEEAYRTLIYDDNRRRYDMLLRERNELPEMPPLPPAAMPKYQPQPAQPSFPHFHEPGAAATGPGRAPSRSGFSGFAACHGIHRFRHQGVAGTEKADGAEHSGLDQDKRTLY
jgi:curved DNA-binding protein CbpA